MKKERGWNRGKSVLKLSADVGNPLGLADPLQVGWRVTFKVVDTLTVRPQMAGRPFEEQPHELYRK